MRQVIVSGVLGLCFVVGCDSLRFAPGEAQKQNACMRKCVGVCGRNSVALLLRRRRF
jgi:hypothetical protein